ncbi:MAG: hypothetical protein SGJ20_14405 [Planctomycetota bacterium]|nr:hypothetical protein [Planctomycetota bacterium]
MRFLLFTVVVVSLLTGLKAEELPPKSQGFEVEMHKRINAYRDELAALQKKDKTEENLDRIKLLQDTLPTKEVEAALFRIKEGMPREKLIDLLGKNFSKTDHRVEINWSKGRDMLEVSYRDNRIVGYRARLGGWKHSETENGFSKSADWEWVPVNALSKKIRKGMSVAECVAILGKDCEVTIEPENLVWEVKSAGIEDPGTLVVYIEDGLVCGTMIIWTNANGTRGFKCFGRIFKRAKVEDLLKEQ